MKKKLSLILILILIFVGCSNQEIKQPNNQNIISSQVDSYFMDLSLDVNAHQINGTQKTNYINKENQDLDVIYFHLYPNIYQNDASVEKITKEDTYPNGFDPGNIKINKIEINGQEANVAYENDNKLLKIILHEPLKPSQSVMITFQYTTKLPNSLTRMGHNNNSYNLTGFYPVAAVYDESQYVTPSYTYIGDPFFTDVSDYYVNITLPKNYNISSTGELEEEIKEDKKQVQIKAKNVRELAITASDKLNLYEDYVDDIKIVSMASNEKYGKIALNYAKEALSFYNNTFGKYPYSKLTVVESEFYGGGMEYPNLVLITKDIYNETGVNNHTLEWIIAHEIAHQWWYGVVGSNPIDDCFVDESLTEYSTLLYTRNKYDDQTYNQIKKSFILSPYENYKHLITDPIMHKSTTEFSSNFELSMLVYVKGTIMYTEIEKILGEETLKNILKDYYQNNMYEISSSKNLINHFKNSYDYDWDTFFNKWLYNK